MRRTIARARHADIGGGWWAIQSDRPGGHLHASAQPASGPGLPPGGEVGAAAYLTLETRADRPLPQPAATLDVIAIEDEPGIGEPRPHQPLPRTPECVVRDGEHSPVPVGQKGQVNSCAARRGLRHGGRWVPLYAELSAREVTRSVGALQLRHRPGPRRNDLSGERRAPPRMAGSPRRRSRRHSPEADRAQRASSLRVTTGLCRSASRPSQAAECHTENMGEQKTVPTDASVEDFLDAATPARRREDGLRLAEIFHEVTGADPVLGVRRSSATAATATCRPPIRAPAVTG